MRCLFLLLLLLPLPAKASFLLQYALNYSSEKDTTSTGKFTATRTFHKAFLAGSINGAKTLFFGWNINSWNSTVGQGSGDEDTYSLLEMGPRIQWFTSENYNLYFNLDWNPYAKGTRDKSGTNHDINGSSLGLGFGYRFRLSKTIGFGASLQYHALSISKETTNSNEKNVSDKVNNIMPMLEFTLLTR